MANRLWLQNLTALVEDAQDVGATIKALAERNIEVVVLQLGKLDLASSAGKLDAEHVGGRGQDGARPVDRAYAVRARESQEQWKDPWPANQDNRQPTH